MGMGPAIIKGFGFEFASLKLAVGPVLPGLVGLPTPSIDVSGLKGLDFDDSVQESWIRTNSPMPVTRTRGEYSAKGSISFWKGYTDDFLAAIGAPAYGIYGTIFTLTVSFQETINPYLPVLYRQLLNCRITNYTENAEQGSQGLADRLSLSIQAIGRASASLTGSPQWEWPFNPAEMLPGIAQPVQ